MRLETTAPPGLVGPGARWLFVLSPSAPVRAWVAFMALWPVAITLLTGSPWWLVVSLLVVLGQVRGFLRGASFVRRALAAGAPVVATWHADAVTIERRTGEVAYEYRSLHLHGRRRGLVAFRVDLPLRPRPLWLVLPNEVVPADVEDRIADRVPAAHDLQHVGVVPVDFGHRLTRDVFLHSSRRLVAPFLLGFMLLDALLFVILGAWYLAVPVVGFVLYVILGWRLTARTSLRHRPVGSDVGTAITPDGLVLESATGRAEVPFTRVRNVDAIGPRHVMLLLRGPRQLLVLPREVVPDAAIDHVRRALGKAPLLARQRIAA